MKGETLRNYQKKNHKKFEETPRFVQDYSETNVIKKNKNDILVTLYHKRNLTDVFNEVLIRESRSHNNHSVSLFLTSRRDKQRDGPRRGRRHVRRRAKSRSFSTLDELLMTVFSDGFLKKKYDF